MNRALPSTILGGMLLAWAAACVGCGITKSRMATEQLVISDAVDRAVASLDFSELAGQKVYFETKYAVEVKPPGQATQTYAQNYVLGSVRQQLVAYDVRLQEKADTADYILELRIGALGTDGNELTFGIPASTASTVAAAAMSVPGVPSTPEISVGRRNQQLGAAKLGLFAYHRESGRPVWQQGISAATSDAKDLYILGLGPFQRGKLYSRGAEKSTWTPWGGYQPVRPTIQNQALAQYSSPQHFAAPEPAAESGPLNPVQPATHLEPVPEK